MAALSPNLIITESNDKILKFTLNGVNVSIANAIRRILLSEIPTVVFKTTPDKCTISKNTSRLNNEIIKQRLGCIPVHITDMDIPVDKYRVVIKKKNDTDTIILCTTGDFEVYMDDKQISKADVAKLFPRDPITNDFIDFIRLRPALSSELQGEEIDMQCFLSIGTAKEDSMFNVDPTATYGNTPVPVAMNQAWTEKKKALTAEGHSKTQIEFEKKNWMILDGQRLFTPDSFDFVIETVGVFDNKQLLKLACTIMISKLQNVIENISNIGIQPSETTIPNSFDVRLEGEDYTLGKVLEYFLYENYYLGNKALSFVGFSKQHPHDDFSIIRAALREVGNHEIIRQYLMSAATQAAQLFTGISDGF